MYFFQLKKDCHTAPFPPKRVRNSNTKVLEQRRAGLEIYMQKMLRLASTKQQVLNFLGIDGTTEIYNKGYAKICLLFFLFLSNDHCNACFYLHSRMQTMCKDENIVQSSSLQHHPVLTFHCDPYVLVSETTSLPDIVTNGVLLGIYKS